MTSCQPLYAALTAVWPSLPASLKLPLNPIMTKHSYKKSKRRLREWVYPKLVAAAAFPLGKPLTCKTQGDIFAWVKQRLRFSLTANF